MHCDMKVCNTSDPSCTQTCGVESNHVSSVLPLAKRDVSMRTETASLTYTNTDGPIRINANTGELQTGNKLVLH